MSDHFEFGPFRVDPADERLWCGSTPEPLRPKTFAVLKHLVENAGRLVPHEELLEAIWGQTAVTPGTLNTSIRELRKALGDDARKPRYIETAYRRGFRFVAEVRRQQGTAATRNQTPIDSVPWAVAPGSLHGRSEELGQLEARLAAARAGARQAVFVTGELGVGKTSLLKAFVESRMPGEVDNGTLLAWGKSTQRHDEGEFYQPVLDALDRLIRLHDADQILPVLIRFAPSWVLQIPWVLDPDAVEQLRRQVAATDSSRMLRELCVAVESLAKEQTLVLVLEDLHWSDPATVDLIEAMAERTDTTRLLLLMSYRPVDAAMSEHPIAPLRRKLKQRGKASDLPLDPLDKSAVQSFLCERFDWSAVPAGLTEAILDLSDGNPLFMVTLTNYLVSRKLVQHSDAGWGLEVSSESLLSEAPESLHEIVQDQLATLGSDERELLEAASVAGDPFAVQALAPALEIEVAEVERRCERLARWGYFIEDRGVIRWPDGTSGGRFGFQHVAFQQLTRSGISPIRRRELHSRIADRLVTGYAAAADLPAAEIAAHYEEAADWPKAVAFLARAAANAQRRLLHAEAVSRLRRALELLTLTPQDDARDGQELDLRLELARSGAIGFGWGGDPLGEDLDRCLQLSRRVGDRKSEAITLDRMVRRNSFRSDYAAAGSRLEELRAIVSQLDIPALDADVAFNTGLLSLRAGELDQAADAFAATLEVDVHPAEMLETILFNPRVLALCSEGYCAWVRGYPDDASSRVQAGISEAEGSRNGLAIAAAQIFRAELGRFMGRADEVRAGLERYRAALESGGVFFRSPAYFAAESWLMLESGEAAASVANSRQALGTLESVGTTLWTTCLYGVLAEALQAVGDAQGGLRSVDKGLEHANAVGEHLWEAELHRLKGELLRLQDEREIAEAAFLQALDLSRRQGARSLELRTATALARLWHQQGERRRASDILEPVLGSFDQGHDTRDLLVAQALVQTL